MDEDLYERLSILWERVLQEKISRGRVREVFRSKAKDLGFAEEVIEQFFSEIDSEVGVDYLL